MMGDVGETGSEDARLVENGADVDARLTSSGRSDDKVEAK